VGSRGRKARYTRDWGSRKRGRCGRAVETAPAGGGRVFSQGAWSQRALVFCCGRGRSWQACKQGGDWPAPCKAPSSGALREGSGGLDRCGARSASADLCKDSERAGAVLLHKHTEHRAFDGTCGTG
jgi:hypothetical protein